MGAVFHGSLTDHKLQLEKALRTFKQNPTPALANSIKRLQQAIKTQTKSAAKRGD